MKKIAVLGLSLIALNFVKAQIKDPVKWNFSAVKKNTTTYEVHLTGTIDAGWHVYSQTTPAGGPVATTVSFTKNPLLTLDGTAKEVGKLEQKHEPLFGVDVKQFSGKIDFVQTIKVKGNIKTSLNGTIDFMTCNDHECLPPKTQSFSIVIK
jgi:thiol:disulfide interchange protein DsbD